MRIKPIVFAISVAGIVAYILIAGVGSTSLVLAGSEAPLFKVRRLNGEEISLSNLKGRVVFLNFWRTDCAPCAAEMPDLDLVARTFAGRKFEMMPISLDFDASDVARFYLERRLTMPAYLDSHHRAAEQYNITWTPETFIIDSNGSVAKYYAGPRQWASPPMLAMLEELIPD